MARSRPCVRRLDRCPPADFDNGVRTHGPGRYTEISHDPQGRVSSQVNFKNASVELKPQTYRSEARTTAPRDARTSRT
jgi:hypothetical protein